MTEACDDCRRYSGSVTRVDALVRRAAIYALGAGGTTRFASSSAAYERALTRLNTHRETHRDAA